MALRSLMRKMGNGALRRRVFTREPATHYGFDMLQYKDARLLSSSRIADQTKSNTRNENLYTVKKNVQARIET